MHEKAAMDPVDCTIQRADFDTLYSFSALDSTTPASIFLFDIDRCQILEVIDEEHQIPLVSDKLGRYELNQQLVGG